MFDQARPDTLYRNAFRSHDLDGLVDRFRDRNATLRRCVAQRTGARSWLKMLGDLQFLVLALDSALKTHHVLKRRPGRTGLPARFLDVTQ
ncbi:hypothetical protein D3C76_514100 [compost metagenome]